jgi:hypothetical protein
MCPHTTKYASSSIQINNHAEPERPEPERVQTGSAGSLERGATAALTSALTSAQQHTPKMITSTTSPDIGAGRRKIAFQLEVCPEDILKKVEKIKNLAHSERGWKTVQGEAGKAENMSVFPSR